MRGVLAHDMKLLGFYLHDGFLLDQCRMTVVSIKSQRLNPYCLEQSHANSLLDLIRRILIDEYRPRPGIGSEKQILRHLQIVYRILLLYDQQKNNKD